jgi:sulfite reductase alpha subunit-like flavoprotein
MALLDRGGLVYVCGDASRMAPDVRSAFAEVYAGRQQSRGWCAADR